MRLLLNDTSAYHSGCKVVIDSYEFDESIPTKEPLNKIDWKKYDTVILNGEGTMHHSAMKAMNLLRALRFAYKAGAKIEIHNTVWQDMVHDYDDVLRRCSKITTREVLSHNELLKHNVVSEIVPDRSILADVPYKEYPHVEVYQGGYYYKDQELDEPYPRIDIFTDSWAEIVNRLRHADLLITGRHHEMYAAIKARCRFIAVEGNSWKNRGVAETVGVTLPTTVDEALSGEFDDAYRKIFDWAAKR